MFWNVLDPVGPVTTSDHTGMKVRAYNTPTFRGVTFSFQLWDDAFPCEHIKAADADDGDADDDYM